MKLFENLDAYAQAVNTELGVSDWVTIDQAMINKFIDTTGDDQWIHTDEERTMRELNHGIIAHGYLTLSLVPVLGLQVAQIKSVTRGINYGSNKMRFHNIVPVDSRVRLRSFLKDATRKAGGMIVVRKETIEIENVKRPALSVETLSLYFED